PSASCSDSPDIGDGLAFETPGHLAAYAGIAPVTRGSGYSICGEFPARSGNKRLTHVLFNSAWVASNHDPISKAYYDRKRTEGKHHNSTVNCLARRAEVRRMDAVDLDQQFLVA